VLTTVISICLPILLGGIGWLIKTAHVDKKERESRQCEQEKSNQQTISELRDVKNTLDTVVANQAKHSEALRGILKSNIEHTHEKYSGERKIPRRVLNTTEKEFESYRDAFNGNGYINDLMADIREYDVV
jgi:hypothetical protein